MGISDLKSFFKAKLGARNKPASLVAEAKDPRTEAKKIFFLKKSSLLLSPNLNYIL